MSAYKSAGQFYLCINYASDFFGVITSPAFRMTKKMYNTYLLTVMRRNVHEKLMRILLFTDKIELNEPKFLPDKTIKQQEFRSFLM
jgi:hypothetical protein